MPMLSQAEPTPTPTITIAPEINPEVTPGNPLDPGNMLLFGQEVNTMAVIVTVLALMVALTLVFVRALVKAGNLPPPAALVTALSVLTMMAIAGGIFSDSQSAWTIAAAGIGALAGSVTAVFRDEASVVERVMQKMEVQRVERRRKKEEEALEKAERAQEKFLNEQNEQIGEGEPYVPGEEDEILQPPERSPKPPPTAEPPPGA